MKADWKIYVRSAVALIVATAVVAASVPSTMAVADEAQTVGAATCLCIGSQITCATSCGSAHHYHNCTKGTKDQSCSSSTATHPCGESTGCHVHDRIGDEC